MPPALVDGRYLTVGTGAVAHLLDVHLLALHIRKAESNN